MPNVVPQTVRDVLGEQAAADLATWFDQSIRERAVPRDEYREVLSRLDVVEHRVDETNSRLDRMEARFDERFNQVDARFDQMNAQMNERFDHMHERFDRMHEQMRVMMRWTVGAIVIIGAIITTLLAIAEFAA